MTSLVEEETRPRRRRTVAADWDKGRAMSPAIEDGEPEWARILAKQPDTLYAMIADIVKVTVSAQGPTRTGRRPAITGMSFDQAWGTLFPERYTLAPFAAAMTSLLAGRSQRLIASRAHIGQNTLSRLIMGKQKLTLQHLEAIAAALHVPPGYFVEYRALKIAEIIAQALVDQPNLSITWLKRISRGDV